MIEREIKQILTKELYEQLIASEFLATYPKKQQLQINYYYDTSDYLLYESDITLRVRQKESNLSLEMKYPVEDKSTYKVKREITKPILELPIEIELEHQFDGVSLQGKASLIQSLVTERTRIYVDNDLFIDLDKSHYLGVTDYELEIEFNEDAYEDAHHIFKLLIPSGEAKSSRGKKARLFHQYFLKKGISHGY
ncbi:CYTH domain-containing protein [Paenibacillus sp. SYP-B3998]|uniref:CYTH domain-containing protein n=1 Tax=Paenibacillus sp. SYP-B3998 TaxID=2678564 RepID=A0A6G4A4G0_9BACL|nr:CYTH domain-containing protein [Paenibacillus sp. SYP-B3998]NEW08699.1 CYTH domain-containing protein [Paenibacillus sp. SYP-B3998]